MTREEAIRIIRETYHTDEEMNALESLIPELREIEDERIRKAIVATIEQCPDDFLNPKNRDRMLAYLEKQKVTPMPNSTELIEMWHKVKAILKEKDFRGDEWRLAQNAFMDGFARGSCVKFEKQKEQKPIDYPCLPGWRKNRDDNKPELKRSVLMLTTHGVAEGEWLGEKWCQYRWACELKDGEVLYWMRLSDLEWLEKEGEENQKEQKPTPDWMPKFLDELRSKKNYFDWDEHRDLEGQILAIINWIAPNYFNRKEQNQKPVEKQDYSGLNDLERAILRGFLCAGVENVPVTIIKETAQECLAQMKPAEWSGEDDVTIKSAVLWLEKYLSTIGAKDVSSATQDGILTVKVTITNLKSLRPSWKPSEEQMKAIESCFCEFGEGCPDENGLRSLYNELKKLM